MPSSPGAARWCQRGRQCRAYLLQARHRKLPRRMVKLRGQKMAGGGQYWQLQEIMDQRWPMPAWSMKILEKFPAVKSIRLIRSSVCMRFRKFSMINSRNERIQNTFWASERSPKIRPRIMMSQKGTINLENWKAGAGPDQTFRFNRDWIDSIPSLNGFYIM